MRVINTDDRLNYIENIGKRVMKNKKHNGYKISNVKPFKSGEMYNTVKGVIWHPILGIPAYIFEDDDSYVACKICRVLIED